MSVKNHIIKVSFCFKYFRSQSNRIDPELGHPIRCHKFHWPTQVTNTSKVTVPTGKKWAKKPSQCNPKPLHAIPTTNVWWNSTPERPEQWYSYRDSWRSSLKCMSSMRNMSIAFKYCHRNTILTKLCLLPQASLRAALQLHCHCCTKGLQSVPYARGTFNCINVTCIAPLYCILELQCWWR